MKQLLGLLICILCVFVSAIGQSDNNLLINVQGALRPPGEEILPNGPQNVTFRLYKESAGGDPLWIEAAVVRINNGVFAYNIGQGSPLDPRWFVDQLYLGIEFNGAELTPRSRLTTAPYALNAFTAQTAFDISGCKGGLGDIVMSVLPPDLFKQEYGDCWEPMNGLTATGTELQEITGLSIVPDAQGKFIRGYDGRVGNENRDPDRGVSPPVATLQGYALKNHEHPVEEEEHRHPLQDFFNREEKTSNGSNKTDVAEPFPNATQQDTTAVAYTNVTVMGEGEQLRYFKMNQQFNIVEYIIDLTESRPKNINLYLYMRVRR
jgi:hypothetical protein